MNADKLTLEVKTDAVWMNYGPRYKAPVLQFNYTGKLAPAPMTLVPIGNVTVISPDFLEGSTTT